MGVEGGGEARRGGGVAGDDVAVAGGTVRGYSSSTGFYIHAKAIVADYGLSTQKVQAGSMNFSSNSQDNNRELGIVC